MRLTRVLGPLATAAAMAAILASSAAAAVTAPAAVTGPSPFAIGCAGAGHDPTGTVSNQSV